MVNVFISPLLLFASQGDGLPPTEELSADVEWVGKSTEIHLSGQIGEHETTEGENRSSDLGEVLSSQRNNRIGGLLQRFNKVSRKH